MFIEIRKQGKKQKYYLVHSYRIGRKVKRISRYLGSDLKKEKLERLKSRAEKLIQESIRERDTFQLTNDEIGEFRSIESKIQIIHLQKALDWEKFTKEFSYNTNAIEGSAVKLGKAKKLIDNVDLPHNYDEIETVNLAKAIDFIKSTKEKLSIRLIKELHSICFEKTKSFAGKLRDVKVVIKDKKGNIVHTGAPSEQIKYLLENMTMWYYAHQNYPPLLLAALIHNQFEHIHPFQDGNGRVGRLLLNYVLLKHNYPPINIRFKNRSRYYETLRKFDNSSDIIPTIRFLISQYKKK